MIDKLLIAARKLAADYKIHARPSGDPPEFFTPDEKRLAVELETALDGADVPDFVIETDVEAFKELMRLVTDYFNAGRSPSSCRKCGAPLVWILTTAGANAPLDAVAIDGIDADGAHHRIHLNHFATCPAADEIAREKKAAGSGVTDGKTLAGG